MSAEDGTTHIGNAGDSLADQLRQLEAFVARAEAAGGDLPPEAVEMVDKLKEIIQALEGLTSSLDVRGDGITLDEVSSATREEH